MAEIDEDVYNLAMETIKGIIGISDKHDDKNNLWYSVMATFIVAIYTIGTTALIFLQLNEEAIKDVINEIKKTQT